MAAFWETGIDWSYDPPWFLFICNFLFTTVASAVIMVMVSRSFLRQATPGLLLLACGILFWGLAGVLAASIGGRDYNASISIHNTCTWFAALSHLLGVMLASPGRRLEQPGWCLVAGVAVTIVLTVIISRAAVGERLPVFFVQGEGGTLVRSVVLGSAAAMFLACAAVLRLGMRAVPTAFADWYAIAMATIGTGIIGLAIQREHGGLVGWTARSLGWLGSLYLIRAALAALRETDTEGISLAFSSRDPRLRYALALVFVLAGAVLRLVLIDVLGPRGMLITFYPAVILASLYGGRGPGIVATGLSVLLVNLLWVQPYGYLERWSASEWLIIAFFVASSITIAFIAPAVAMAEAREAALRASEKSREELRIAKEEAEAASRAKDDFLAMLSHELRTPLTPVLMTASALRDDNRLPEAIRKDAAMIERNITLEARLIDDLLDLTRISRGKLEMRSEHCDVHSLILHTLDMVRDEAREKRIELATHFNATRTSVTGDPARLQQVFWNLLRNAVKFTPVGGHVGIRTFDASARGGEDSPNRIAIEVSDDGMGFPPERAAQLFEPFEQLDKSRHRLGGVGLGLAIARAIVDLHDGAIRAESSGAKLGATFTVELPSSVPAIADEGGTRRAGGIGDAPEVAAARPLRLLVVEDDEATLHVLGRLLRHAGHEVVQAVSVAEARTAAAQHTFDGVISDLGLSDGTGLELMAALRAEHGLRGIVISGYGMAEDVRQSRQAGFIAHLVKPVEKGELFRALQLLGRTEPQPPEPGTDREPVNP